MVLVFLRDKHLQVSFIQKNSILTIDTYLEHLHFANIHNNFCNIRCFPSDYFCHISKMDFKEIVSFAISKYDRNNTG